MIFTVGHSNRSFDEFARPLKAHKITLVIDVRSHPSSRWCPWFNRSNLENNLPMKYLWKGDVLGGIGCPLIGKKFEEAIDEVAELSKAETVAVMCSEKEAEPTKRLPEGCHRYSHISPAIQKRGIKVTHI